MNRSAFGLQLLSSTILEHYRQDDRVRWQVRDEGPGLSAEEQARLFQTGVRLSPQPTAGEPSSGYGLAVAKQLMDLLGGTIGY